MFAECSFLVLYAGQPLMAEVVAWPSERGFRLSGVNNMDYGRDGRAIQGDFLFSSCPPPIFKESD